MQNKDPNNFTSLGSSSSLRPIIIDGSNVAMQFGKCNVFATRGILICVRFFLARGHNVLAFVPQFRQSQNPDHPRRRMSDQHLLDWMHYRNLVAYTPSRNVFHTETEKTRVVCYDDYFIVQCAHDTGGIIVSKDQYRDVSCDHPEWAETIQKRLLMFSWAGDRFMVPNDPLGAGGIRLEDFLLYQPGESICTVGSNFTSEERELLLREIDEVLANPHAARPTEEQVQSCPTEQELTASLQNLRFGFLRKSNSFNHRNRRWLSNTDFHSPPSITSTGTSSHVIVPGINSNDAGENLNADLRPAVSSLTEEITAIREEETNEQNNYSPKLYKHFCEFFPPDIVKTVLSRHQKIEDLDVLANLLTDALL